MITTLIISLSLLSGPAPLCGNSSPDPGEECDDGNLIDGDGCSSMCLIDSDGFFCTPALPGSPDINLVTDGSFEDLNLNGDWTEISHSLFGSVLCESDECFGVPLGSDLDGNIVDGAFVLVAGSSFSEASTGVVEHAPMVFPTNATTLTFNWGAGATDDPNEPGNPCPAPDDGLKLLIDGTQVWSNTDDGDCMGVDVYTIENVDISSFADGNQHTIRFEGTASVVPFQNRLINVFLDQVRILVAPEDAVPPTPSVCYALICGDGLQVANEQCDDGNVNDDDGCSALCEIEQPNFVCTDGRLPADSANVVADGSFEAGSEGAWTASGSRDPQCSQALCEQDRALSGAFYAWFGDVDSPDQQVLSQSLILPITATTLEFGLTLDTCDSTDDNLIVRIDQFAVFAQSCDATAPAVSIALDISAFADGALHALSIEGNFLATNGGVSSIFVDDVVISDNVPFAGLPSACTELPPACSPPATFDAGIPPDWTVINLEPNVTNGWGTSDDGQCVAFGGATGNETSGSGPAACASTQATGTAMDTYLCSPALDLTQVTDPQMYFLANYQTPSNVLMNDDFLSVLVGAAAPNALTVQNYLALGEVIDHLDTTFTLSGAQSLKTSLADVAGESEVYVCYHYRSNAGGFAQIDNVALRGSACAPPFDDPDQDGIGDQVDNCTLAPNPSQLDTDEDGHGNICDADFNNDCIINAIDLGIFRTLFFQPNNQGDLNGDGITSVIDLGLFRTMFFSSPGPSANGICSKP